MVQQTSQLTMAADSNARAPGGVLTFQDGQVDANAGQGVLINPNYFPFLYTQFDNIIK